jgi:hypothetical protein
MSAMPDTLTVHPAAPVTVDRAEVVALDAVGAVVGRATLRRLYGSRAELTIEDAPTTSVALALVDAMEREAQLRGLARLELAMAAGSERVIAALRRWRDVTTESRGRHAYLTWPTTPKVTP